MFIGQGQLSKQNLRRAKRAFRASIVYSEDDFQADAFLESEDVTDLDSKIKILQELFHIEIVSSSFGPNGPTPINDYETRESSYWDLLTMIRFKYKAENMLLKLEILDEIATSKPR